ncbi:MAG: DNA repair protein RadC [Clostridia bacterium]|nr:DNA repair protein RadC [Clostridia bacterium]
MSKKTTIAGLPEYDRPYEKLELSGASSLTDSELLAVLIRSGTKEDNALTVSRELLRQFDGSIKNVFSGGISELRAVKGIGKVKALQIKAVAEACRRIGADDCPRLATAEDIDAVGRFLSADFGYESKELFKCVLLDTRLRVLGIRLVSQGALNGTLVHPREVFSDAVRELCYGVIVAHNHPGGSLAPSQNDIALTGRLVSAGQILGIQMLDHFIVTRTSYVSFKRLGIIDNILKHL